MMSARELDRPGLSGDLLTLATRGCGALVPTTYKRRAESTYTGKVLQDREFNRGGSSAARMVWSSLVTIGVTIRYHAAGLGD